MRSPGGGAPYLTLAALILPCVAAFAVTGFGSMEGPGCTMIDMSGYVGDDGGVVYLGGSSKVYYEGDSGLVSLHAIAKSEFQEYLRLM